MDVSAAQDWWQEWQLRILVLGSLFIQSTLYLLATQRKHAIPSLLRSTIWLMYIGGDAVAIYAFATLFSRQKQQTTDGGSRTLELLWAPILLVHLGGQANITVYSLEDSKLWKQHVLILVSKFTITLYMFVKWWPRSDELTVPVVLPLLILGMVKFIEKPVVLWIGSYDRLVSAVAKFPQSREHCELSLQEYVRQTNQYIREAVVEVNSDQEEGNLYRFSLKMVADLPASYSDRLKDLQSFLKLDDIHAYAMLQRCHGDTFQRLYTRKASSRFEICYFFFVPFLCSFFTTGFIAGKKGGHDVTDVRYRLMSFCTLRKKPTILMKLATFKCIRKYLHEHWYVGQVPVAFELTKLIRRQVMEMRNMYIHDVASYGIFNNCRGQWTLHRLVSQSGLRQQLGHSLKVPFDQSVTLWHIAADLCFHQANAFPLLE